MKWTRATEDDVFGTGLRGTFKESYARLVEVLGEPHRIGSGDGKIQVEWLLRFDDGTIATVYDYKEDEPSYAVEDWHVGGGGSRRTGGSALQRVLELFGAEADETVRHHPDTCRCSSCLDVNIQACGNEE